jgi:hypothetical protein
MSAAARRGILARRPPLPPRRKPALHPHFAGLRQSSTPPPCAPGAPSLTSTAPTCASRRPPPISALGPPRTRRSTAPVHSSTSSTTGDASVPNEVSGAPPPPTPSEGRAARVISSANIVGAATTAHYRSFKRHVSKLQRFNVDDASWGHHCRVLGKGGAANVGLPCCMPSTTKLQMFGRSATCGWWRSYKEGFCAASNM